MDRYYNLEEAMCKELEKLDKKYGGEAGEMTPTDAERADMLYHALKSAETYHAMKDAGEWEEESGRSYRGNRGGNGRSYAQRRDSMGRYTSRDMDGMSGHYPPYPMRNPMEYGNGDWRY